MTLLTAAFVVGASPSPAFAKITSTAPASDGVRAQSLPAATCGQSSVALASAASYAALSGTGVTSTGATALTGDIGVSPGTSLTGFPPGTYTGTKNAANSASSSAKTDLTTAYNEAAGRSNCAVSVAGNIGGLTLTPGLYKSTSSLAISSGDLTLSGGGNPNGVFVFQVASAFTSTSGRAVILSNGAQAGNVYWQIGSSATLGTGAKMQGTIMTYASITMLSGAQLNGRALARTGDVTLSASTIVVPTLTTTSTYAVTFTQNSLPSGTDWSATLAGTPMSSTSTTIGFTVANGTYAYSVGTTAAYAATPSSGSVAVNGQGMDKTITFAGAGGPGSYAVTFTETGVAVGTNWSVALNGIEKSSTNPSIVFTMANGTNAYTVGVVSGFTSSPSSGSMTVTGTSVNQAITFTSLGGGDGGGGAGNGAYGFPAWAIIGIVALAAIGAVAAILILRRRKPAA